MADDLWTYMTHEKDVVRQTGMERGDTGGLQRPRKHVYQTIAWFSQGYPGIPGANEQLQEENRTTADRHRATGWVQVRKWLSEMFRFP